ncbi:MAG TPA: potassium channel family protein, partial [Acidimicrobiales bacterium]|nr:potassium channel family protein [Acidimicrobiales bacterium]
RRRAAVSTRRDPWRRVRRGVGLLVAVMAFGTIGYEVVGLDLFDAAYQTAITVTTVGYGEVGPPGEVDRAYRAFTLLLVLAGASSAVYTASVLLETLVEGSLNDGFRRRRMLRQVDRMRGHVIVAGWGRVGHAIAHYAERAGTDVVVVDQVPPEVDDGPPVVVGDATEDDTLLAAGIERAATLVAALSSDSDNLSLTLAARSLRSDLVIVARAADKRNERKFLRAGANRVVNPYEIGGSRMGAIALQPHVAEFLDEVLDDEVHDVAIRQFTVGPGAPAAGAALADVAGPGGAMVVAVRDHAGGYVTNPVPGTRLVPGDVLIALGSEAQLRRLADAAAAP